MSRRFPIRKEWEHKRDGVVDIHIELVVSVGWVQEFEDADVVHHDGGKRPGYGDVKRFLPTRRFHFFEKYPQSHCNTDGHDEPTDATWRDDKEKHKP